MTIEALLVYDVRTGDREGERRLRRVARACEGLGVRVQKSVFEVRSTAAQLVALRALLAEIVVDGDCIRLYRLDRGTLGRVDSIGRTAASGPGHDLIL